MALIVVLVVAIGALSLLTTLVTSLGKLVLWVGLPLLVVLIVGALITNIAGPKAGAVGALLALGGIIACAKKIFS